MQNKKPSLDFYEKNASSFDSQRAKLAPIKDALHFCIQMLFSELPNDAKVLCVGVGTGSELIYLAKAFPQWRFTAVDPAPAMLDICRQRAEEAGITSRCTFHEGYLDSLPTTDPFDAATSILVSHSISETEKQNKYFTEIAARLRPGAYMVDAALASDMSSPEFQSLLDVWINTLKYAKMLKQVNSLKTNLSLLSTEKIEVILKSSGFEAPVLFFQTLLIHAWFAKVSN